MSNTKKKIPAFKTAVQEREFWKKQGSTPYVDWKKAKKVLFPNLKPTLRTVSLRLPESMIARLKILANMDIVKREEFEAVKAMAEKARAENERLAGLVAALEARIAAVTSCGASRAWRAQASPTCAANSPMLCETFMLPVTPQSENLSRYHRLLMS